MAWCAWCKFFTLIGARSSHRISCIGCVRNEGSLSRWAGLGCVLIVRWLKSFWSTLKNEFYDRRRWVTCDEVCGEVARWIEVFYNRQRRHSVLGFIPPVQFEQDHARPVRSVGNQQVA